MATKQNIYIDQGTTFTMSFAMTNPDGTPVDLTGYTGRSYMKKEYTDSTYYSFTVDVGGNTGVITISLTPDYSSSIEAGRYFYDLELESSANVVTRIIEGLCTINPEVTR